MTPIEKAPRSADLARHAWLGMAASRACPALMSVLPQSYWAEYPNAGACL